MESSMHVMLLVILIVTISLCLYVWWNSFRALGQSKREERPSENPPADLPDMSLRDPVTGLYNAKHLLRRLQENTARCDRSKERMAIVLWDIDGFISFNNRFGQAEGDKLLKKVAEHIRRSLRAYDEAFRAGGDEFCAILIPADDKTAGEVTQRVSQIVSKELFEGNKEYAEHQFSMSYGTAFYPGDQNLPEGILHAAGQSLYKSRMTRIEMSR